MVTILNYEIDEEWIVIIVVLIAILFIVLQAFIPSDKEMASMMCKKDRNNSYEHSWIAKDIERDGNNIKISCEEEVAWWNITTTG
jgi:hypothetical protein